MDLDEAQRALDEWGRGRPGFVGSGRRGSGDAEHLVLYVGPAWEVPATQLPRLDGIRIAIERVSHIRPL